MFFSLWVENLSCIRVCQCLSCSMPPADSAGDLHQRFPLVVVQSLSCHFYVTNGTSCCVSWTGKRHFTTPHASFLPVCHSTSLKCVAVFISIFVSSSFILSLFSLSVFVLLLGASQNQPNQPEPFKNVFETFLKTESASRMNDINVDHIQGMQPWNTICSKVKTLSQLCFNFKVGILKVEQKRCLSSRSKNSKKRYRARAAI